MVALSTFLIVAILAAVVFASCLKLSTLFVLRKLGVLKNAPKPLSPVRRAIRGGVIVLGITGVLCIGWGFIEPYYPVVETVRISSDKISAPIRIVQISDLHCDKKVRAEEKMVRIIASLKPDFIVFTGDGVNSDDGIPTFRRTLRALSKIAPLFGVRGNWEAWWFTHVDTFKDTGLVELNGEARPLAVSGQKIWITGTAVDDERLLNRTLKQMPKDAFRIVLHHFPAASKLVDGHADLLLSGDTHGGQLRLPLLGPLIRIRRWDDVFYPIGLHHTPRGLHYYVNRGFGMEGHAVPRVRFNCPPEITLFEIN